MLHWIIELTRHSVGLKLYPLLTHIAITPASPLITSLPIVTPGTSPHKAANPCMRMQTDCVSSA